MYIFAQVYLLKKHIYANRQTEIKVNTEYLEKMGYSVDSEETESSENKEESTSKAEIKIKVNPDYKKDSDYKKDQELSDQLDAEYFRAQAEKEAKASKETKEITDGIHKMWRNLVNKD